ncbi:MAG TPA: cupredoxin family copper-binding protein [Dongiaceae bacterium]|nr:cupredoxin family copper-binding protein [Dongiaceae bacterium]
MNIARRTLAFFLAAVSVTVVARGSLAGRLRPLAASAAAPADPATQVTIDNFSFAPRDITVAPGTTITWKNRDDIPHTVVSDDKSFKSRALDTDDSFSYKFEKPGSYPYFCSLHPKMTAKVVVQ